VASSRPSQKATWERGPAEIKRIRPAASTVGTYPLMLKRICTECGDPEIVCDGTYLCHYHHAVLLPSLYEEEP
jgi:hypothetical protein